MWSALATVYVLWGSTYFAIRILSQRLPPLGSAGLRFMSAGAMLAVILALRGGPGALRVRPRQLAASGLVGLLLLTGANGLVTTAESPRFGLPSGVAALLIALTPLYLVGLRAATGDRPRAMTLIGIAVGLAGLVVLFAPGPDEDRGHAIPVVGGVLILIAVVSWGTGSFATRWLPLPANPFVASVYEMVVGGAALAVIALLRGEPGWWAWPAAPVEAWLALAYLTIAGSLVAYSAYVWLLHHAPISLVATYAYVNPVIALALGAVFLSEPMTPPVLLSAATVLLGVILVVSTERNS
jgi:drug/metabolite transporter (DMT)-like permease